AALALYSPALVGPPRWRLWAKPAADRLLPKAGLWGNGLGGGLRRAGSSQQDPIVSVRASSMGATVSRSSTARTSVSSAGDRSVGGMSGRLSRGTDDRISPWRGILPDRPVRQAARCNGCGLTKA